MDDVQHADEQRAESWVVERERRQAGAAGRPSEAGRDAGHDESRGRSADAPSQIPARGWKDIVLRIYRGIGEDRILLNAAGVTFYVLLALFPALAALVSIYGLFADPATIAKQLDMLSGILPGGGMSVIRDQLTRVASNGSGSLTIGFVIGLLVSLWSANGGMKGLFDALNAVYEEEEKRSFLRLTAVSLAFTLGLIGFAIVAITCIVAIPIILSYLPEFVGTAMGTIINIARWPLMAVLVAFVLALVYRYGPSRDEPKWRWISWGSVLAAVGWLVVSGAFSYYAAKFGTFNKTYGSLGAVIGFMLWIWLSVIVILLGGKLNAEIEHQTARDNTKGPPRPLGQRDATMADTIGRAQS
ncbi:MAG: YihY/virulence factor BrkB family protein [Thiohalocapsa sp.]